MRVLARAITLILLTAGAVAGCGPGPGIQAPAGPSIEATPGQPGLGVRIWPVRDQHHALARVLVEADEAPIAPATRQMLREAGVRIVAVPIDQLGAIHNRLPAGGPTQRQWLRSVPAWHEAVSGPQAGPSRVMLDNGPLALDAGRARLMVRAWVEPAVSQTPTGEAIRGRMHLELVPEHVMELTNPARQLGGRKPIEDHLVFDRLVARWNAVPGMAYLIVGEQPGADWAAQAALPDGPNTLPRIVPETADEPPVAGPDETGDQPGAAERAEQQTSDVAGASQSAGAPPGPGDGGAGPAAIPTLTLGEMILGPGAYAGVPAPVRRVLVLVPVAPARYALVP